VRHAPTLALALAVAACSRGGAGQATASQPPPFQGEGPGPRVGEMLGAFEAPDQRGARHSFETLRGPNGLLLNFNRSVVW
jgi:hypothetical protein